MGPRERGRLGRGDAVWDDGDGGCSGHAQGCWRAGVARDERAVVHRGGDLGAVARPSLRMICFWFR